MYKSKKNGYKIIECSEAVLNHYPAETFNVKYLGKRFLNVEEIHRKDIIINLDQVIISIKNTIIFIIFYNFYKFLKVICFDQKKIISK